MDASSVIRHLLEADDPLDIGPLAHYTGPIEFDRDIKDILDHAQFLRSQAERAGALNPKVIGNFSSTDLNRAFLQLAAEDMQGDKKVSMAVKRLRQVMHSIWD